MKIQWRPSLIVPEFFLAFSTLCHAGPIEVSGIKTYAMGGMLGDAGNTAVIELPKFNASLGSLASYNLNFGDTSLGILGRFLNPVPFGNAPNALLKLDFETQSNFSYPQFSNQIEVLGATCNRTSGCSYGAGFSFSDTIPSTFNISTVGPGGFLPITATTSASSVEGTWNVFGKIAYSYVYNPKTTYDYVKDALQLASSGSNFQRASDGYSHIINLRESDASTSGQNIALRDAEYFLRGYAGAAGLRGGIIDIESFPSAYNDIAIKAGPIALAMYNAAKIPGSVILPILVPDALPMSPLGGFSANYQGYLGGIQGESPLTAIERLNKNLASDAVSTDPNHPTVPKAQQHTSSGALDIFYFDAPPTGTIIYLDPPQGNTMLYGVAGNRFSSIFIPNSGSGEINLSFESNHVIINAGELFSFLDYFPEGVDGFGLEGLLPYSLSNDPFTIGLSLMDESPTIISAFSSNVNSNPIPEPTSILVVIMGLMLICLLRLSPPRRPAEVPLTK